jgi:hypothetical protein
VAEYRAAINIEPKLGVAHYALCMALGASRQYDEAIEECNKATKKGIESISDSTSVDVELSMLDRAKEITQLKNQCDATGDTTPRCANIRTQLETSALNLSSPDAPRFVPILGSNWKNAPNSEIASVDHIVLLPAVVSSPGLESKDESKINLKRLRDDVQKELKSKRYDVEESDDTGGVQKQDEASVTDATPEWIKRVGPQGSRRVMIVTVDMAISGRLTGTFVVSLSGYLMDRQSGTLIWSHSGQVVGDVHAPATDVIGAAVDNLLFPGLQRGMEVRTAVGALLSTFPSRLKTQM